MAGMKIAFLGLGEVGAIIASNLLREGFDVRGFDVSDFAIVPNNYGAGANSSSFQEAAKGAGALIMMVSSFEPFQDALFSVESSISGLANEAVVVIISSVPPSYVMQLDQRLAVEKKGLLLVDAPIIQSFNGKLVVLASGSEKAMSRAKPILSAISEDFIVMEGGLSSSSKVNLVNTALIGIHLAAAAEAIALGTNAGLDIDMVYNIISNAAGSSSVFVKVVPHMITSELTSLFSLHFLCQQLNALLGEAKALRFPLPLTTAAQQQVLQGCASGYGQEGCSALVKIWKVRSRSFTAQKPDVRSTVLEAAGQLPNAVVKPQRVAFVGLGAMGFGMACHLVGEKFSVCGFDVSEPSMERFKKKGGDISESPEDAARSAEILIVMVTNEDQAEAVLYGDEGAVHALPHGAAIILCSTVSPSFVRKLDNRLAGEHRDLLLVDAPVSGGVARASNGTLTIMAAGSYKALAHTRVVLSALSENLYIIDGGPGAGSSVKMVNQLLAGVHIAAAAEAMALGARLGLDTRDLYNLIAKSSGSSWMFVNRVPHMLDSDYRPLSALDIFVKDLGIVLSGANNLCTPVPLAAIAHQQFLFGSAAGWGREDDASVVKIFEQLGGISVAAKVVHDVDSHSQLPNAILHDLPSLPLSVLSSLPSEWPEDPINEILAIERKGLAKVLVVLDDDPTGTQTVHGIAVLTEWSVDSLKEEFEGAPDCFFILTNSRAMSAREAALLTIDICSNVEAAAAAAGNIEYTIVLRGDSTLRGHFPEEADAASVIIGETDAWIICPFFLQGGRYTISDVHYVSDGNMLVPAGKTEFAQDAVFGYRASNLREWIEEKTQGRVAADAVASVSIETIRNGGPSFVCEQLCALKKGSICIVNSASERDMAVFAAGMIQAEARGKRFLCRTAAAFVSARIGLKSKAPIIPSDIGLVGHNGGLIVVGSYVPKTTQQVEELKVACRKSLVCITVNVNDLTNSATSRELQIEEAASSANLYLAAGKDTLIMTSRELVIGKSASENLKICSNVSSALVEIVKRIKTKPRYVLAKGGITSSDLATKAMNARRAEVVGQALAGVPIWRLGPGSRYPGVPYIVFPGNVGGADSLAHVVCTWSKPTRPSTKDLFLAAEKGGYALGAFNVYNLEGVKAVIAAAEAEHSPAILQIHPAAFHFGGGPLVACCVTAAKLASVPITVHFDHGSDEGNILEAMELGFDSVMVDGSLLSFKENLEFTQRVTEFAHSKALTVEAELGRLSGTEDNLAVPEYEAKLTDVNDAETFLQKTKVDALAVCIGNVHGKYPQSGPALNLALLEKLHTVAKKHKAILVLHGASGLPSELVMACIKLGVRKFNVNTEVRSAYVEALQISDKKDLVELISSTQEAMQLVVAEKLRTFGSSGKAQRSYHAGVFSNSI